jgi:hypothetical protein
MRIRLLHHNALWRNDPATIPQARLLRSLDLDPAKYPTKGRASDAIERAWRRQRPIRLRFVPFLILAALITDFQEKMLYWLEVLKLL